MQVASNDGTQADPALAADDAASATASEGVDNQEQGQDGAESQSAQGEGEGQGNAITDAAKQPNHVPAYQKRIDELTRARREAEREAAELRAKLAQHEQPAPRQEQQQDNQPITLDHKALDALATERARQMAEAMTAQQSFDNACNTVFETGIKAHGDAFKQALQTCGQFGILDDRIVSDALATDAPHEVLFKLGQDPEEALRIAKLPQAKRIAAMVKLADAKPAKPPVSRASPPVQPIGGNAAARDFDPMDDKISDEEWHRREDERERAARAAR